MDKPKVLFLCTGNSARSQMAEAFLRHLASDRFEVFSAGLEAKGMHPMTIQVMQEKGISLDHQYSKPLTEYMGKINFEWLITVCDNADKNCPFFPGMGTRLHWPFEDPAAAIGAPEERLAKFRQVRDAMEVKIKAWLAES
jgi:arsenate reductase (thioredoxin)